MRRAHSKRLRAQLTPSCKPQRPHCFYRTPYARTGRAPGRRVGLSAVEAREMARITMPRPTSESWNHTDHVPDHVSGLVSSAVQDPSDMSDGVTNPRRVHSGVCMSGALTRAYSSHSLAGGVHPNPTVRALCGPGCICALRRFEGDGGARAAGCGGPVRGDGVCAPPRARVALRRLAVVVARCALSTECSARGRGADPAA